MTMPNRSIKPLLFTSYLVGSKWPIYAVNVRNLQISGKRSLFDDKSFNWTLFHKNLQWNVKQFTLTRCGWF